MYGKITLTAVLALLAVVACAGAASTLNWSAGVTTWHYNADAPHSTMVMIRQIGTNTDTVDDTHPVNFIDINGNHQNERASDYMTLDLSSYLPDNAKVAQLSVKTIITKPTGSTAVDDIFVFIRTPGSACCVGPVNSPATPVDFSTTENPDHDGIAAQSVLQTPGGIRDFVPVTVVLVNGKAEVSWGYQRGTQDSVGFDIYLDGYGT